MPILALIGIFVSYFNMIAQNRSQWGPVPAAMMTQQTQQGYPGSELEEASGCEVRLTKQDYSRRRG